LVGSDPAANDHTGVTALDQRIEFDPEAHQSFMTTVRDYLLLSETPECEEKEGQGMIYANCKYGGQQMCYGTKYGHQNKTRSCYIGFRDQQTFGEIVGFLDVDGNRGSGVSPLVVFAPFVKHDTEFFGMVHILHKSPAAWQVQPVQNILGRVAILQPNADKPEIRAVFIPKFVDNHP